MPNIIPVNYEEFDRLIPPYSASATHYTNKARLMLPQPRAMDSSFKRIYPMRYSIYIALCVAAVYWTLAGSVLLHSARTIAKQHERGLDLVYCSDMASTCFDQRHRPILPHTTYIFLSLQTDQYSRASACRRAW